MAISLLTPVATPTPPAPELDPEIIYALEALPGGVATSPTSAEWPDLGITFDLEPPRTRAVGSCSTGLTCAYRNANQGGARVTFTGCATWSTVPFGSVGSVANARTSGWTEVRNGSGSVLTSVGYGLAANVQAGTATLVCKGDGIIL